MEEFFKDVCISKMQKEVKKMEMERKIKIFKVSWKETEGGDYIANNEEYMGPYYTHRSIIGIIKEDEELKIRKLAGKNLPAVYLKSLLLTLPKEWLEEAESLHSSRRNAWSIDYHEGSSGCRDYYLYTYLYEEDFPGFRILDSVVHVSMFEKLDEEWYGWLGDIPPLFSCVLEDYEQMEAEVKELVIYDDLPKHNPGEPSGLLEKLRISEEDNEYEKF